MMNTIAVGSNSQRTLCLGQAASGKLVVNVLRSFIHSVILSCPRSLNFHSQLHAMRATHLIQGLGCLLLSSLSKAVPFSPSSPGQDVDLSPRAELVSRAPTCNTPTNRACWTTGFNINTDYEASFPATGVVRNYNLLDNPSAYLNKALIILPASSPSMTIGWVEMVCRRRRPC